MSDPRPVGSRARRPEPVCIEVQVRWGDHVLQVSHLRPARTFRLGETAQGAAPCDVFVPREYVGDESAPVVLQGPGDMLRAVVLPGAEARIELPTGHGFSKAAAIAQGMLEPCPEVQGALQLWLHPGVSVCSRLSRGAQGSECGPYRRAGVEHDDALVVIVGWVEPERRLGGRLASWPGWMQWVSLAATLIAHAVLFVCVALAMPALEPTETWVHDWEALQMVHMPFVSWNADIEDTAPPEPSLGTDSNGVPWEATACGEPGALGDPWAARFDRRYGIQGPEDNPDPHLARYLGEQQAWFSYIGLTPEDGGGARHQPIAPWGRDDSLGTDAKNARGAMFGASIGSARGSGGLGPNDRGTGSRESFSRAGGRIAPTCESPSAGAREESGVHPGTPTVSGSTPLQAIRRVVQAHAERFRHCADSALRTNPGLRGQVMIQARIGEGGELERVGSAGSDAVDDVVVQCLVQTFGTLSFPEVTGGAVDVVYPMVIAAGG